MMLKTVSQIILESTTSPTKYGCLMVDISYDQTALKKLFDKNDICEAEGGIEDNAHVTILYGFHKTVDPKAVLELVEEKGNLQNLRNIALDRVSLFKNDKADVLKFDIKESEFYKLNKLVCKNFEYTNKYPSYHAHATIAYLMPGMGEKYLKKLANVKLTGKATKVVYSTAEKKKSTYKI